MVSNYILALAPVVFVAWVILAFTRKRTPAFATGFLLAIGGLVGAGLLCRTIELAFARKVELMHVPDPVSAQMLPNSFSLYVAFNAILFTYLIVFCSYNLFRVLRGKKVTWIGRKQS